MHKLFSVILIPMLFALAACAGPAPSVPPGPGEAAYVCPDVFAVAVPQGWERAETGHPYGDLTRIAGVRLRGPADRDGVQPEIAVLYYFGDGIFPTTAAYIKRQFASPVRLEADREPPVGDVPVAGRWGGAFRMATFVLLTPPAILPQDGPAVQPGVGPRVYEVAPSFRKVRMDWQFIVVPAERGFYVLSCGVPEGAGPQARSAFARVVQSFRPLLP